MESRLARSGVAERILIMNYTPLFSEITDSSVRNQAASVAGGGEGVGEKNENLEKVLSRGPRI